MKTLQAISLRVDPANAALVVIDIQERLAAAMPKERLARAVKGIRALVEMARRFEVPVLVTQQYPKGLGTTIPEVEECFRGLDDLLHRFDKVEFSVCAAPPFEEVWKQIAREQWLVTGMETHVCVYQTVRQLAERGARVFVPVDTVLSRDDESREVGLRLLERCDAVATCSETIIFDTLGKAEGEHFKALSKLIK